MGAWSSSSFCGKLKGIMASFYRATVQEFLQQSADAILARLAIGYAKRGYSSQYAEQTLVWQHDIRLLQAGLGECVNKSSSAGAWGVLLEFSIPRKEFRIDVVLLINDAIVLLETKAGTGIGGKQQIEEYALLLHYFHKASAQHKVVPIVVSSQTMEPAGAPLHPYPQLPSYWIGPVRQLAWSALPEYLLDLRSCQTPQVQVQTWDDSPYCPVPSIIEAATALRTGLSIREIAHSEASEHEIEAVGHTIQTFVDKARTERRHAICFVTGVPGSGKTLVGLSVAHSERNKSSAVHFMSGNGPLVRVLQHLFIQESMRKGAKALEARTEAKTLIENVHVFARHYTEDYSGAPSNHAIVFDEAQRAWNRAQNLRKFKRDYSEPEMLLRIMERHSDWAVVVALVGGGQEINDGEAGLEEWGRALANSAKDWVVYASPEVLSGGVSTAGHRLFDDPAGQRPVQTSPVLHLRTCNRSIRSEQVANWVNLLLEGEAEQAASLNVTAKFPIFLSRNLNQTRSKLREQHIGATRYGLVGCSGAARLRTEGLEPNSAFHADYPWQHWYLAGKEDVRSSYRCEVFATEFEIQGLELDWIGLCWGGDFIWTETKGWQLRALRHGAHSLWRSIASPEKRTYRKNAYRVLLTRARQGMFIFVPKGDAADPTSRPEEFDATAQFLIRCGVIPLSESGR
jgi:hypothetical protein